MDTVLKNISIELPITDISFIKTLIKKMGWTLKSLEDIDSSPKNISIPHSTDLEKQYSPRITYLRSLHGNGITQKEINDDERLAYLLNR